MKISIEGFRCHINVNYEFRDGSIILLSGPSGGGKSTIFQAIYWCLYGNLRGIYNNSGELNKCSVTLDFPLFIIYRQGRPGLLKFSYKDNTFTTYEDAVAQQLIYQQFGKKEIWKSCCYIEQGSRCTLLSGSNSERMELLNNLSFVTDDPEACISRIDAELKSVQKQFHTLQVEFQTECDLFGKDLRENPVNPMAIESIKSLTELKIYILKLQEEINHLTKVQLEQRHLQGIYQTLTQTLMEKTRSFDLLRIKSSISIDITPSYIEDLRLNLDLSIKRLDELRMERTKQQQMYASYQIISESLNNKNKQLEQISKIEYIEIEKQSILIDHLGNQYTIIRDKQEYLRKYQIASEQLEQIKNDLNINHHDIWEKYQNNIFTQQDVWNASEQERSYNDNFSLSCLLNVSYDEDIIMKKINFHRSEIEKTSKIDSRLCVLVQIKELENLLGNITDMKITEQEVIDARDALNRLKQGADLLQCPHCKKSVRYFNEKLIPGDRDPVSSSQIEDALLNFTKLSNGWENSKKAEQIRSQLLRIIPLCGDRSEIEKLSAQNRPSISEHQKMIDRLSSIRFVKMPIISSSLICKLIKFNSYRKELELLTASRLSPPKKDPESIQSELFMARKKLEEMKHDQLIYEQLTKDINTLNNQLDNIVLDLDIDRKYSEKEYEIQSLTDQLRHCEQINQLQDEISSLKQEIEKIVIIQDIDDIHRRKSIELSEITTKIMDAGYAKKMTERQNELEKKKDVVSLVHQQLIDLQRLRQSAVEVECQQLQTTVDSINQTMAEILNTIFDTPITVTLKLYKQLKTDKRIKPSVNIIIQYRGAEYDSINSMSGGEGDRISFALILSLNRVSTSPILLLDESMASLNTSLRESCLLSLRESVCGTKTILCVNHEDIEGHYDDVIRF